MIRIAEETPADAWEIEALLDTTFAPGRTGLSSYRLREGVPPIAELCLTARDDDPLRSLAGCIRFWPVRIGGAGSPSLLLGPIAVHPTRQGEGIGAALMLAGLDLAADEGWTHCVLIGDEPYYQRFGFRRNPRLIFPPPTNPNRILSRALGDVGEAHVSGEVRRWTA